jgi:prevent-host-death family protein
MTRVNVTRAREEFPELVNRAAYGKERTVVSRRGKDLAAVVPMEDWNVWLARRWTVSTSKAPTLPSPNLGKASRSGI